MRPLLGSIERNWKIGKSKSPFLSRYRETRAQCTNSLRFLRVDRVFAVDCGGDGLTGGVDLAESVELARDRQVHHALASSGLAYQQIVVSPGCDAESSVEVMSRAAFCVASAVVDAVARAVKLSPGAMTGAFPNAPGSFASSHRPDAVTETV